MGLIAAVVAVLVPAIVVTMVAMAVLFLPVAAVVMFVALPFMPIGTVLAVVVATVHDRHGVYLMR